MNQQLAGLPQSILKRCLSFWMELVKLSDTNGLPADLIWCQLRKDGHPIAAELTSDAFEKELHQQAQLRQLYRAGRLPQEALAIGLDVLLKECGA